MSPKMGIFCSNFWTTNPCDSIIRQLNLNISRTNLATIAAIPNHNLVNTHTLTKIK